MGPNGSGKSTLSKALAGHPSYVAKEGTAELRAIISLAWSQMKYPKLVYF